MNKLEYDISDTGLGTLICLVSTFLHSNQQIVLNTNKPTSALFAFKSIFNIPDSQLLVNFAPTLKDDIILSSSHKLMVSDIVKTFAPYLELSKVNVLGQQRSLRGASKPCVALLCYNNYQSFLDFDPTRSTYPDNRYHSIDEYADLFRLIKSAGYEVMTLDSMEINLEQKVYMLNELCDAVVCYEGGLGHLAHLLKIPTVLLPYRYQPGAFRSRWNPYLNLLHLDKRTYFVESMDEVKSWTTNSFRELISSLYNELGNNLFLSKDLDIEFSEDFKTVSIYDAELDLREVSEIPMTDFEYDFYNNYIKELKMFNDITPKFIKKTT